jgi:hypothetical protein
LYIFRIMCHSHVVVIGQICNKNVANVQIFRRDTRDRYGDSSHFPHWRVLQVLSGPEYIKGPHTSRALLSATVPLRAYQSRAHFWLRASPTGRRKQMLSDRLCARGRKMRLHPALVGRCIVSGPSTETEMWCKYAARLRLRGRCAVAPSVVSLLPRACLVAILARADANVSTTTAWKGNRRSGNRVD